MATLFPKMEEATEGADLVQGWCDFGHVNFEMAVKDGEVVS